MQHHLSLKTITVLLLQFALSMCINTKSWASSDTLDGWHTVSFTQLDYTANFIGEQIQELTESEDDDEITYKTTLLGIKGKNMVCKTPYFCTFHKEALFVKYSLLFTFSNLPPPAKQAI